MVDLNEFIAKLSGILNSSTAPNVPTFTLDGLPVWFDVKSPSSPRIDSIADKENKRVNLPVMVQNNGAGSFEAYPDMGFFDISYTIIFRFPVSVYESILAYFNYLADNVVGKILDLGANSGSVICGLGAPQTGQMVYLEASQFSQVQTETAVIFGNKINITRQWMDLQFQFYMSGANGLGKANGIIFANQVEDLLTIKFFGDSTVSVETLRRVSPSLASSSLTYEQQGMNKNYQGGLITNTGHGGAFTVFVFANSFWHKFITEHRDGTLIKSTDISLSTHIATGSSYWWNSNGSTDVFRVSLIKDVSFSYEYGKPITCTFSLEPKITPGTLP